MINGGAFSVPAALGNKIIHPFSDFALHNIGTGDGIVQNAGQGTANLLRTPPLWGIRARNRLMHEGLNITIFDSIQLHAGQATAENLKGAEGYIYYDAATYSWYDPKTFKGETETPGVFHGRNPTRRTN